MTLGRCRQKVIDCLKIDINTSLYNWLSKHAETRAFILVKESLQDRAEYSSHGVCREIWDPNHTKVTEKSWSNLVTTTTWRAASTDELGILNLLEDKFLGIIETSVINCLSQKFARWLRTVCIKLRHIKIINEENHLLTTGRSKQSLSLSL